MFYKLNQNFIDPSFKDWSKLKSDSIFARYNSITTVLEYRNILDLDLFRSLHRRKISKIPPSRVAFTTLEGTGSLFPHIDHECLVALNFYVLAGQDSTKFYQIKDENSVKKIQYPGKKDAKIYHPSSLIEKESFIANANDAYLLNVSKIHSVEKISKAPRIFMSYLWNDHSYEEVLKSIKELENDLVLPE
jgi:hypothetical protein